MLQQHNKQYSKLIKPCFFFWQKQTSVELTAILEMITAWNYK